MILQFLWLPPLWQGPWQLQWLVAARHQQPQNLEKKESVELLDWHLSGNGIHIRFEFNQNYFFNRPEEKNALAISSSQSKPIDSYSQVKENYNRSLESDDLKKCPDFWGGYSFVPYYFEFWEGHQSRINKREVFEKMDCVWKQSFLQP